MNLPSLAAIAQAIDDHYDEQDYGVVYNEDGVCIDSAAARAVLALMSDGVFLTPDEVILAADAVGDFYGRVHVYGKTPETAERLRVLAARLERAVPE